MSYEWPVMPFTQQHPVRGFFGDPRIGDAGGTSFHFGIDVSVADGTPVYSVRREPCIWTSPAARRTSP